MSHFNTNYILNSVVSENGIITVHQNNNAIFNAIYDEQNTALRVKNYDESKGSITVTTSTGTLIAEISEFLSIGNTYYATGSTPFSVEVGMMPTITYITYEGNVRDELDLLQTLAETNFTIFNGTEEVGRFDGQGDVQYSETSGVTQNIITGSIGNFETGYSIFNFGTNIYKIIANAEITLNSGQEIKITSGETTYTATVAMVSDLDNTIIYISSTNLITEDLTNFNIYFAGEVATQYNYNHNLNSNFIEVKSYENNSLVNTNYSIVDANTISINLSYSPTAGDVAKIFVKKLD